jgi:uncharacterized zinc-type alcohol dehydrogenase-like protein
MPTARAFGVSSPTARFAPITIPRRDPGPTDVAIAIHHCGVCHSDLHTVRNDWAGAAYPLRARPRDRRRGARSAPRSRASPSAIASASAAWSTAASAAASCQAGLEQYCETNGTVIGTYNSARRAPGRPAHLRRLLDGDRRQREVRGEDPRRPRPGRRGAAPVRRHHHLLAAAHWKVGPGTKVGSSASAVSATWRVKLGKALGAHLTLFTTSRRQERRRPVASAPSASWCPRTAEAQLADGARPSST